MIWYQLLSVWSEVVPRKSDAKLIYVPYCKCVRPSIILVRALTIQKRQCIRLFSNCFHYLYSSVICNKCMLVIYFHVCCTCKGLDKLKGVDLSNTNKFPSINFFLNLHHWIVMSKYIICQSFKKFHRAVFSIAHLKYSNVGGILEARGSDITIFFSKHSFLFFYYHQMNLLYSFIISKILVYIFNFFLTNPWNSIRKMLSHISGIFDNIFRWTFFLERDISMICWHVSGI